MLAALSAIGVAGFLALSHDGVDPFGRPLGTDFLSFWTAARLTLAGNAAGAYDPVIHAAAQQAAFPSAPGYYAFFYPPTFLLICLPLALLPYGWALLCWLAAGFATFIAVARRLVPRAWAWLPLLAFPGNLINLGHGQNGFVTGACLGGFVVLYRRRPFLAGLCLGALVIKPHLLLAAPIGLLAARRWRVLAGAACSGLALLALSWAVLGGQAWRGFLADSPLAMATLEQGLVEPWKMVSTFAAVRLLGGGIALGFVVQAVVGLVACGMLARVLAGRPGGPAEPALIVCATMLCTPFLLDYDLTALLLPIAWLMGEAVETGWRPWEKISLLAAYALPVMARPLAQISGLGIAPLVILCLLTVVAFRVQAGRSS